VLAWDLAAVRHIRATAGLGGRLLMRAGELREAIRGRGFDAMTSTTQIVPCAVGDARAAVALSRFLGERGIRAPAIRPPTVPGGTARVRFSVHLGLSDSDVRAVIDALSAWRASL
jgi:7-keto-8-aminopelargonate synthetase-like enzyme